MQQASGARLSPHRSCNARAVIGSRPTPSTRSTWRGCCGSMSSPPGRSDAGPGGSTRSVRAREDARGDLMRARNRLSKLLVRHGIVYSGGEAWTEVHDGWLRRQRFDSPALQTTSPCLLTGSLYISAVPVRGRRLRTYKVTRAVPGRTGSRGAPLEPRSRPAKRTTGCSAMSMPALTPAAVMTSPSSTHRASWRTLIVGSFSVRSSDSPVRRGRRSRKRPAFA